jgi:hypothetical protein
MERKIARTRLLNILNMTPGLKTILLAPSPLEIKRDKIKKLFSEMITVTFSEDQTIPPPKVVSGSHVCICISENTSGDITNAI